MKKIASLVLVVALLATMLTVFALPASAEEVTMPEGAEWIVDDGDNHIWYKLTENGAKLIIGGTGAIPDCFSEEERPWHNDVANITAIQIDSGVTAIGNNAFRSCTSLQSVTIPSSVTTIGTNAFDYCSGITTLTIPEGVKYIGSGAFNNCYCLEKITIPETVVSIGKGAFTGCYTIEKITIPASVESIGSDAFFGCSRITSVTIPASVKTIGDGAFDNCGPDFAIHGESNSEAEKYAKKHGVDFFVDGKCKHFAHLTCETCKKSMTKGELLAEWGEIATASVLGEGSLTIIVGVVALAVGLGGGLFVGKKKKSEDEIHNS